MTQNDLLNHTVTLKKEDFASICRCCLSVRKKVDNIFQLKFHETSLVDIFKLFGIQVNSSDSLPKTICASCTTALINFYNFKRMYDNSVATLLIISQNSNEVVENKESRDVADIKVEEIQIIKEELDKESQNESNDQETINESDNNASTILKETQRSDQSICSPRKNKYKLTLPYFCKTCNKWITTIGTHKHSTSRKGSHVCEICGKSYLLKAALEIHNRIHKLKLLANKDNDDEKEESNLITEDTIKKRKISNYQCSCEETFNSLPDLIQHKKEKNHQDPLYKNCGICKKPVSYKNFKKHLSTHSNERLFVCEYCKSPFKTKGILKRHMTIHTGENFACEYCGSRFTRKGNLDRHIKIHTGDKPHVCEFCGKRFIQKNTLDDHRRVHTGEKPFICDFCGKGFVQKMALVNHRRSHTGEKPYLCDHCGKTFRSKVAYNSHLKLKHERKNHDKTAEVQCEICNDLFSSKRALKFHVLSRHGEEKYVCTDCGKRFHSKKGLDDHLFTHTNDEEKIICDLCGKSFKHLLSLKVHHKRIHSAQKNYSCKVCYKAFRRNNHLVAHMRIHTGEKPFACPHCDKTFAHNVNRVAHIRLHTGERPYVCNVCPKKFYLSSSMTKHRQSHLKNDVGIELQESVYII